MDNLGQSIGRSDKGTDREGVDTLIDIHFHGKVSSCEVIEKDGQKYVQGRFKHETRTDWFTGPDQVPVEFIPDASGHLFPIFFSFGKYFVSSNQ